VTRITTLTLTREDHQYTSVPMPGANASLSMLRLGSARGAFTLHGHFPAGFDRTVPGGYHVSEEFLLLEGELEFDGRMLRPGDLTYVPAHYLRTRMASKTGCAVLAWFGGPAVFVPAGEFDDAVHAGVESVSVLNPTVSGLLETPESKWVAHPGGTDAAFWPVTGDVLSAGLTEWARFPDAGVASPPSGAYLARIELG